MLQAVQRRVTSSSAQTQRAVRALSAHLDTGGLASKVYKTPEEALHDFTDGVKVCSVLSV